jgi:hypothetical protein
MHCSWDLKPRGISTLIAWLGQRQEAAIWTGLKWFLERQGAFVPHG